MSETTGRALMGDLRSVVQVPDTGFFDGVPGRCLRGTADLGMVDVRGGVCGPDMTDSDSREYGWRFRSCRCASRGTASESTTLTRAEGRDGC